MSVIRSVIHGCGSYLPPRLVTNDELSKTVDTTDEWIQARTGIRQRHIADDDALPLVPAEGQQLECAAVLARVDLHVVHPRERDHARHG